MSKIIRIIILTLKNMKKLTTAICILFISTIFGQTEGRGKEGVTDTIEVNFDKTIYLIFDSNIISVDVGNGEEVLETHQQQKVLLKANKEDFKYETNALVETANGYYSFVINYSKDPKRILNHYSIEDAIVSKGEQITDYKKESTEIVIDENLDSDTIKEYAKIVLDMKKQSFDDGIISKKMQFFLTGLYYHDNYIYMKLRMNNKSNIPYDISFMGVTSKNRKASSLLSKPKTN